jgi:hypothetical protein
MSTRTITTTVIRRSILTALGLGGMLIATASASAQDQVFSTPGARGTFELRPYVGAYVPTGDQRDLLKDAVLVGAQTSWRILPQLAVTGTFGWSPSKDRVTAGDQTLDIYQYDVGAEGRAPSWFRGASWDFTPFVGLGIGGRTYNYRDLDVDSKTNVAGYGALGGELGFGRLGLRVEGRDYVSRFEPLTGTGDAKTRNDLTFAAGLTVRF